MIFTAPQLSLSVCKEEPEYNPAFGRVVKNRQERKELAKQLNMVEVGNEKPSTIHKESDKIYNDNMARDYED